ncbi:MAG TPA: DEAD/DEAH box helicase [Myxococcota bacterium]|nr:DEAD/DEAH box helicase [Myxococcota bacterium]HRY94496.1 DEAD/DEAH box helicase [Myxococcota bacterium]
MRFEELKLIQPLLAAVQKQGYDVPTPIQAKAIPEVLAGHDVLGCAQTGTGKTAAFALPILQNLVEHPVAGAPRPIRVLVLTPTRELAAQVEESFKTYGANTSLRTAVLFGGVGQSPQVAALRAGVDVLVATPGRLLDLMNQGHVRLDRVGVFVLDEADRMLDMGFIHDIRRVAAALPRARQTLLFSATLLPEIRELAGFLLSRPVSVSVTPAATPVEAIAQRVHFVEKGDKPALLAHMLVEPGIFRALVFTRTKHGADKVVKCLARAGIQAAAIHGNKSQGKRERALDGFRDGSQRVLVATDIAARGLDVEDISAVFNYDLPHEPEVYVHRIGRTGRAGASGLAISFCASEERDDLRAIERLIHHRLPEAPLPAGVKPIPAPREVPGSRGQRPRSQQAQGNRPRGDRPQGSRPQAGRSQGRPPQGNRSRPSASQGQRRFSPTLQALRSRQKTENAQGFLGQDEPGPNPYRSATR